MGYNKELQTGPGNYHGVYFHKARKKYVAMTTSKPQYYIGSFDDEETAALAWDNYTRERNESEGPFNIPQSKPPGNNTAQETKASKANAGKLASAAAQGGTGGIAQAGSSKTPAVASDESDDLDAGHILANQVVPAKGGKIAATVNEAITMTAYEVKYAAAPSDGGAGAKFSSGKAGHDSRFQYGVHWHKRDKRWIARAQVNGKNTYMGGYLDEEEAARAYDNRAAGLGFPLNFPFAEPNGASSTSQPSKIQSTSKLASQSDISPPDVSLTKVSEPKASKPKVMLSNKSQLTPTLLEASLPKVSHPTVSQRNGASASSWPIHTDDSSYEESGRGGFITTTELVWVKHATFPWWPAQIGKHMPEHLKHKPSHAPSGTSLKFVVFFGAKPSCAWLPERNVKPFRSSRTIYAARCQTVDFKLALKQADAEVLKQNMPPQNPKIQTQHPKPSPQTNNAESSLPTATVRTLALDLRQPLGLKANESNLVVTGVDYKSLAYVAGIKPRDRIFKVGDMQVSNVPEIKLAIATYQGRGDHKAVVYVDVGAANQIGGSQGSKRTESDISDGYETNDSDSTIIVTEDNASEDDGIDLRPNSAIDLVWAKHSTSPWWPARLGEPNPEHLQMKPAGESSLFVVFFGSRPSCAWVPEQKVKAFIAERAAHAPRCKTIAFLLSLKQADAEAQKQAAFPLGRDKRSKCVAAARSASIAKRQRGPDAVPQTPPTPMYTPQNVSGLAEQEAVGSHGSLSRYKGVSWKSQRNKWVANLMIDRTKTHLGYFNDEEEAAHKYDEAVAPLGRPLNFLGNGEHEALKSGPGGSSRCKGVTWSSRSNKWAAQITIDGKRSHLGYFDDEEEAALKYDDAAAPVGKPLNFPGIRQVGAVKGKRGGLSRYKRVCWHSTKDKCDAYISIDGNKTKLGSFDDDEQATHKYDEADAPLGRPLTFTEEDRVEAVKVTCGGSSRYKGVSWNSRRNKWKSVIKIDDKKTQLGYFDDEQEAARKHEEAAASLERPLKLYAEGPTIKTATLRDCYDGAEQCLKTKRDQVVASLLGEEQGVARANKHQTDLQEYGLKQSAYQQLQSEIDLLAKERVSKQKGHLKKVTYTAKECDSHRAGHIKEVSRIAKGRDSAHSPMLDSVVLPLDTTHSEMRTLLMEAKDRDAVVKEGDSDLNARSKERAENLSAYQQLQSELDSLAKERDSERDKHSKEVARIVRERDAALARSEMLDSIVLPLETMRSEMKTLLVDAKDALLDAGVPKRQKLDKDVPYWYGQHSSWSGAVEVPWNVEAKRAMTPKEGIVWLSSELSSTRVKNI